MNNNKTANLFDLIILLTVCISFTSIALLVFNTFHPYSAAVSGFLLTGMIVKLLSLEIEWRSRRVPDVLLVILLVALFFSWVSRFWAMSVVGQEGRLEVISPERCLS